MCKGTSLQAHLSLATSDGSNEVTYLLADPVEIASFDKVRVSWNLFDTTGLMDVQPVVLYGQEPLDIVAAATFGTADNATGLHVSDLETPDGTYRFASYGLRVTKHATGSPLTVESGTAWAQVEFR